MKGRTPGRPRVGGPGRVAAIGLVVMTAYAALAAVSGRLSPLARGPLLDGLNPTVPYRWVKPPADLASTNQPPSKGVFTMQMSPSGVLGQVLQTSDDQVIIVVPNDAIAPHAGDRQVRFLVSPIDPATLSPPGDRLVSFGNAYRLSATYEPSGAHVTTIDKPTDTILVYPATVNLRSASHALFASRDGTGWTKLPSADNHAQQQAEAKVRTLGYVQVAGIPAPVPSPVGTDSGGSTLRIVLLVAALCVLLVGVGLLLRSRG